MSQTNSTIAVISLLIIFAIAFGFNYNLDHTILCGENINCISTLIDETRDYDLCEKVDVPKYCYDKFSLFEDNEFLCDKSSKPLNCYMSHAALYNRPDLCHQALEYDNCIFQTAAGANNQTICALSDDVGRCYYSYALLKEDTQICDLSENYKSICLARLLG